jgi:hypothetical protein
LKEAVMAWHRLPPEQTKATIKTIGGQVLYGAKKCTFPLRAKASATNRRFPPPWTIDEREEDQLYC